MHYFIDGYNLLFRVTKSKSSLQKKREAIIQALNDQIANLKLDITVVFDGSKESYEENVRGHLDSLEIVYTHKKFTADQYIVDELEHCSRPKQETVVTSDRELARLCKALGASTLTIEEFLLWLTTKQTKQKTKAHSTKFSQEAFQDTERNMARLQAIFEQRLRESS